MGDPLTASEGPSARTMIFDWRSVFGYAMTPPISALSPGSTRARVERLRQFDGRRKNSEVFPAGSVAVASIIPPAGTAVEKWASPLLSVVAVIVLRNVRVGFL